MHKLRLNNKLNNSSSVEKALNILLQFSSFNSELGTKDLSTRLGINKSTTNRLILQLAANNFLQQNPLTKKYMLGPSAIKIGKAATRSLNSRLIAIAQPCLTELSQLTGETTALEILSGVNIVLACQVCGLNHIGFNFHQGEIVPINVAAGAKAILSYCEPDFLNICLQQQQFEKFNENTIVDTASYRRLLKDIKKTGIAYDFGERYLDSNAIAVPIYGPKGPPKAAIVIAGPAFRLNESFFEYVLPHLRETANNISKALFYWH